MKGRLILVGQLRGKGPNAVDVDVGAVAVHPVRANLANDVGPVVGHGMDDFFELVEVLRSFGQLVRILGCMHHPPVDTDRLGSDPTKAAGLATSGASSSQHVWFVDDRDRYAEPEFRPDNAD